MVIIVREKIIFKKYFIRVYMVFNICNNDFGTFNNF